MKTGFKAVNFAGNISKGDLRQKKTRLNQRKSSGISRRLNSRMLKCFWVRRFCLLNTKTVIYAKQVLRKIFSHIYLDNGNMTFVQMMYADLLKNTCEKVGSGSKPPVRGWKSDFQ